MKEIGRFIEVEVNKIRNHLISALDILKGAEEELKKLNMIDENLYEAIQTYFT